MNRVAHLLLAGCVFLSGEANSEQKKTRFVDQAYAGSYIHSPDEFMAGDEFKIQIIDARHPNSVHKELIFRSDSKLIKQLRAVYVRSGGADYEDAIACS